MIEKSKAFQTSKKLERIQHHQTSFTTDAKGTSPDRKHKRRKDLQKINLKQLKR